MVSSKAVYSNIYDDLGTMENVFSYKIVVRNAITEPYLIIAVKGETERVSRTISEEGHTSWTRSPKIWDSKPTRTSMEGRGAEPSQNSSPG